MKAESGHVSSKALANFRICDLSGQLAGGSHQVPGRVRRPGDPRRGPQQSRQVGHPAGRGPLFDVRRRLQQSQRREVGGDHQSPDRPRQGTVQTPGGGLRRGHRKLLRRRPRPTGPRLSESTGGATGHYPGVEQRVRKERPVRELQDLRADCAGVLWPYFRVRPAGNAARRVGLLVHGPHGRLLHGLHHSRRAGRKDSDR